MVDVIDIATHAVVKSIPVHATVHNVFVTPDESQVIAGLRGEVEPGEPAFQVIDPKTDTVAWGMELTGHTQYGRTHHEVRPMAFEAGPDGTTKRAFAQATGINAVFVIDWNARKVTDVIWPPKLPLWRQNADGIQTGDMHGLEVLPDRSAVWASSRLDSRIYGWTLPDLKYIGAVEVGPSANWTTPTPDSRYMYVAISGHTGGTYWQSRTDPEYQAVLAWIKSLPAGTYVPAATATVDFESVSSRSSRHRATDTSSAATATPPARLAWRPSRRAAAHGAMRKPGARTPPLRGW